MIKKLYATLIAIFAIAQFSYAQWTNGMNIYNSSSGNVGIGMPTPLNKLDVNISNDEPKGAAFFTVPAAVNDNPANSPVGGLRFSWYNSSYADIQMVRNNSYNDGLGLAFLTSNTDNKSTTEKMRIGSNGNIGIGTTIPNAKLEVKGSILTGSGDANLDPGVMNLNFLTNSAQMVIGWNRTAFAGEADFINNQGGGSVGGFAFYNHNNSNQETQLMWIRGDGNVGIGTTTPDSKLAVNGTIHSREVKVDLSVPGPDYVFKPDYQLATLSEVGEYVKKNHHLPEIPSAGQMAKDGINLSDMNMKLLKKVEELTLYLIQQKEETDKQNKMQQEQINELKRRLNR